MRAYLNGKVPAFQAGHAGSIPVDRSSLFPIVNDMNESRWTLSDVLTIVLTGLWHRSLKTHISRREARSGLPVTTASEAMATFGGSNAARKPLTENWHRD